ncbi:MAG TPA: TspO/MBR family protein [Longimicrobiales bacterium]|nr:TspO/MBR family protein [Longimicrobiales bacterium]
MRGGARAWAGLAAWVAVSLAAGWVGSRFPADAWYAALEKPAWTPPSWLFAPVWTALYILMGVAAWLVWRRVGFGGAGGALGLFLAHLVLNAAWSWLFFGRQDPGAALAAILPLLAVVAALVVLFWRVRPAAGALMLPYLLWVAYATTLNLGIWRLNPGA